MSRPTNSPDEAFFELAIDSRGAMALDWDMDAAPAEAVSRSRPRRLVSPPVRPRMQTGVQSEPGLPMEVIEVDGLPPEWLQALRAIDQAMKTQLHKGEEGLERV